MQVGYVRLSSDDNKRNYVSIENQKLIINQFATSQNKVIDRWYEDDGFSGYSFERPGFQKLMSDLEEIDTIYVKDFSRLGRHNAKVLLLLDEFLERDKRFIAIDDNYDTLNPDDDVIGIKTWYNERYVKDTSKKIKSALSARQKEGTLMTQVPFGYMRNAKNREIIEVVQKEAEYVKLVYDLYMKGSGYRKISAYLTEQGVPTPSMLRREREIAQGKNPTRKVALEWTDTMIRDILSNDFYIGIYRLHKRARRTIHGKDKRIPKEEQCVFENHHSTIIDVMTFELVQEMKLKRNRQNYRGNRGQWIGNEIPNPFGSCLFCKDCGNRLTPIKRKTTNGVRKYYICSTYNSKGRRYCKSAHLIEEKELMYDVVNYISLCRNALSEMILAYDMKDFESEKKSLEESRIEFQKAISEKKQQLKILLSQKSKDISLNPNNADIISETYNSLQEDIFASIAGLELKLKELKETTLETSDVKKKLSTALEVVDDIIKKELINRRDIEILIQKIEVDENGLPDIQLKYGLSGFIKYSPAEELNRKENEIILMTIKLIKGDDRGYTSAKYLSEKLKEEGINKSKKSVLPYIGMMIEKGILEATDNPLKPYTILKTIEELEEIITNFHQSMVLINGDHSKYDKDLHYSMDKRWYATNGA